MIGNPTTTLTFTLQTQPERCPLPCEDCSVTLEVTGGHSLHEFAAILVGAIGFQFDHAFGFYSDTDNIHASEAAYTLFADIGEGEDDELSAQGHTVGEVFSKGTQMAFLFDYGDGWEFLLSCERAEATPGARKGFRVTGTEGVLPEQYPSWDEGE